MKKPWAGRFREKTSKIVESFTESISFDHRLWRYDVKGSIAHAKMLGKQGIIPKEDSEKIINGLRDIAHEIESGKFRFRNPLRIIPTISKILSLIGNKVSHGRQRAHMRSMQEN